ncbi:N-myc-interactor isoform X2 [Scophthalmus maximus]|uniref:N-myc-interactor isoform X2 n=1 Tax=Scophthalmus maximus TaxID=52904 RepID=UPI001FA8B31B|nr:N-myc-interactor isoform X2 [Scophthalmus maximus]
MGDTDNTRETHAKVDGGLEEDSQLREAKKELETWKMKAERADDVKSRLIVEKLEEDEAKEKAKQEMIAWVKKQDECQKEFTQSMGSVQGELLKLAKRKQDLLDKLKMCQDQLESKRAESTKLKQKFKIFVQIPDTEVRFSAQDKEESDDDSQPIRGVFIIEQRPTVLLRGGQALITFKEEQVASQILNIPKCSVSCEDMSLDVKPKRITMDPAVKFEVHLDVSRRKLVVSNIPPSMPEERMRDRLMISFSRPSRGGAEVQGVEYDESTGTGHITFLHPGVAEILALGGSYQVDLESEVNMLVGPVYQHQLCKFQTFCGAPKRTILLDDIEDIEEEEDLQDHLEIHFQKKSNCGGDIQSIKYISGGKVMQALFCEEAGKRED